MELFPSIEPKDVVQGRCIAESGEFAIYARDHDTYLLVHRHGGTPWSAISVSGDGVFRIGGLLVDAMRHLYRDVATDLHLEHSGTRER